MLSNLLVNIAWYIIKWHACPNVTLINNSATNGGAVNNAIHTTSKTIELTKQISSIAGNLNFHYCN